MRLLLTSAGIKNPSIHDALVDLLGKPIAESSALCIPTANYAELGTKPTTWQAVGGHFGERGVPPWHERRPGCSSRRPSFALRDGYLVDPTLRLP